MEAIERIQKMELYFDTLQRARKILPELLRQEGPVREMLLALKDYYEGGQWLLDYETDERGGFPKELKRGILSQDAIYDFLCEVESS